MSGGNLPNALVYRLLAWDVPVCHVGRQRLAVHRTVAAARLVERFELGGEDHLPSALGVIQRLLPEAIANQPARFGRAVPYGYREHAPQTRNGRLDTPLRKGGQRHLGIAGPDERVSIPRQLGAKLFEVVDFAVEGDHEPAIGRAHRLVTSAGNIDDGQSPESEQRRVPAVAPEPLIIWPSMAQHAGHAPHAVFVAALDRTEEAG